mmetsp:Transcript_5032/g.9709  ORF Transcript_5032/g.9709 Transcript_5032/m.9709 type:complete len:375 (-) Transcript_5032:1737-2861(-)
MPRHGRKRMHELNSIGFFAFRHHHGFETFVNARPYGRNVVFGTIKATVLTFKRFADFFALLLVFCVQQASLDLLRQIFIFFRLCQCSAALQKEFIRVVAVDSKSFVILFSGNFHAIACADSVVHHKNRVFVRLRNLNGVHLIVFVFVLGKNRRQFWRRSLESPSNRLSWTVHYGNFACSSSRKGGSLFLGSVLDNAVLKLREINSTRSLVFEEAEQISGIEPFVHVFAHLVRHHATSVVFKLTDHSDNHFDCLRGEVDTHVDIARNFLHFRFSLFNHVKNLVHNVLRSLQLFHSHFDQSFNEFDYVFRGATSWEWKVFQDGANSRNLGQSSLGDLFQRFDWNFTFGNFSGNVFELLRLHDMGYPRNFRQFIQVL